MRQEHELRYNTLMKKVVHLLNHVPNSVHTTAIVKIGPNYEWKYEWTKGDNNSFDDRFDTIMLKKIMTETSIRELLENDLFPEVPRTSWELVYYTNGPNMVIGGHNSEGQKFKTDPRIIKELDKENNRKVMFNELLQTHNINLKQIKHNTF